MAATDITGLLKQAPTENHLQGPVQYRTYYIDVTDSRWAGILTAATHNIADLAAGEALLGGKVIVTTSFTSAGDAGTIQFKIGSDALCGLMPADTTDLQAGDCFDIGRTDLEDVVSLAEYAVSADTVDMTVASAALTAGAMVLVLEIIDVSVVLAQGEILP